MIQVNIPRLLSRPSDILIICEFDIDFIYNFNIINLYLRYAHIFTYMYVHSLLNARHTPLLHILLNLFVDVALR